MARRGIILETRILGGVRGVKAKFHKIPTQSEKDENHFWKRELKRLRDPAVGPILFAPPRQLRTTRYCTPKLRQIMAWSYKSCEDANTYQSDYTGQLLTDPYLPS